MRDNYLIYLIWLNTDKIIIYDEIPNKVFEIYFVWAEYLNIFEKAYKQLLQTGSKAKKPKNFKDIVKMYKCTKQ